jgi:hypothetical protein
MWPFSRKDNAPPVSRQALTVLPVSVIERGLLVSNLGGVRMAAQYAMMGGFPDDVINAENAVLFDRIIQSPPAFSPEGIRTAISALVRDAQISCEGSFDIHVFGLFNDRSVERREELEAYRDAVASHGLIAVCEASGLDLTDWVVSTSIRWREEDLKAIFAKLDEKRVYLQPLLLRARAKGRNKYGDLDYTEYVNEIAEFVGTYFGEGNLPFFYHRLPLGACVEYLEPWFAEPVDPLVMPVAGIDFEYWCAARLEEQGWATHVSKASGDQGVDIEAMRDGITVAIQCKRYADPIGNKSVQEAYTGMTHYRAHAAAVIGTGGFTKAAIELAANTRVILLDAENIGEFSAIVANRMA